MSEHRRSFYLHSGTSQCVGVSLCKYQNLLLSLHLSWQKKTHTHTHTMKLYTFINIHELYLEALNGRTVWKAFSLPQTHTSITFIIKQCQYKQHNSTGRVCYAPWTLHLREPTPIDSSAPATSPSYALPVHHSYCTNQRGTTTGLPARCISSQLIKDTSERIGRSVQIACLVILL